MNKFWNALVKILPLLPTIGTILPAIYLGILARSNNLSQDQLLKWILVILGLIATSMLIDRFTRLDKIEKIVLGIRDALKGNKLDSLETFFKTRKDLLPLENRIRDAKEIFITGGSLFRLSSEYISTFEVLLSEGCQIKLLMLDPESKIAEITAKNIVYEINEYDVYKSYIKSSSSNFIRLKRKYPDLLEIRFMDYLPSYSLFGTTSNNKISTIMVEIYSNNVPARDRLHFTINKSTDAKLYTFFFNQFEKYWSDSIESSALNNVPPSTG